LKEQLEADHRLEKGMGPGKYGREVSSKFNLKHRKRGTRIVFRIPPLI
jgi:hypothetical protein